MPLPQFTKKGDTNVSISSDINESNDGVLKKAAIFRVGTRGEILASASGVFLLNPSSFEETKTANWNPKQLPGQSDPVMQWTSSGPRTVTFEALVTADTSYFDDAQTTAPAAKKNDGEDLLTKIASLASSFFGITTPPPKVSRKTTGKGDSLDISRYLNYYRSLLYPEYDSRNSPRRLNQSPPLVVLYFGRSLITKAYETRGRISNNHEVWVVTSLKIKVTKQLPNLAPMEATVSFTLQQYNIKSFSSSRFLR